MKTKTCIFGMVSILVLVVLVGCSRTRGQSNQVPAQNDTAVSTATAPAAPASTAPAPTITAAQEQAVQATLAPTPTTVNQPADSLSPSQAQPPADQDISQLTSDILKSLDGLSKDLDSTDTLNDVK